MAEAVCTWEDFSFALIQERSLSHTLPILALHAQPAVEEEVELLLEGAVVDG